MRELHIVLDRLVDPWELPVILLAGAAFWVLCWRQANRLLRGGLAIVAIVAIAFLSQDARVRLGGGVLATNAELQDYYRMYVNGGRNVVETCISDMAAAADRVAPSLAAGLDGVKVLPPQFSPDRCYRDRQTGPYQQAVYAWLAASGRGALVDVDLGKGAAHAVVLAGAMMGDAPAFIGRLLIVGSAQGRKA